MENIPFGKNTRKSLKTKFLGVPTDFAFFNAWSSTVKSGFPST
jgi:hypothetical protein